MKNMYCERAAAAVYKINDRPDIIETDRFVITAKEEARDAVEGKSVAALRLPTICSRLTVQEDSRRPRPKK